MMNLPHVPGDASTADQVARSVRDGVAVAFP
jgi:hypothetical protein